MQKKFDEIRIEDLEVFANHGVFPEENTLGQKFVVSAVLFTDTRMAGKTDDLQRPSTTEKLVHLLLSFYRKIPISY